MGKQKEMEEVKVQKQEDKERVKAEKELARAKEKMQKKEEESSKANETYQKLFDEVNGKVATASAVEVETSVERAEGETAISGVPKFPEWLTDDSSSAGDVETA